MQESTLGAYTLRWSMGGNYATSVASSPIFLLTDPASDPGARLYARRLCDGMGALARTGVIPEPDQVRRVWADALAAAESDLATITLMASDHDIPDIGLRAALLAAVSVEGNMRWLVHSIGGLGVIHDDGTRHTTITSSTELPMRARDRFVLLSDAVIRGHSSGRTNNVISQLPRAQRAAAVLVSSVPAAGRDAATAIVVDVHDADSLAALDFPETLMSAEVEAVSEPSLVSDWAMQVLGVQGRARVDESPLTAPDLDDFVFQSYLGSGGFADVFLYEEQTPKRLVAIKVLKSDGRAGRHFRSEIDVMGQLGAHPSIVSIYDAALAPTGQPYIVMQYCPGPSLSDQLSRGPLPVADALRMGIQLSGATHTAHMLGIAHYDIKPSNVLTTAFGRYALSDFGIATLVGNASTDVLGMSLPWAAPEVLRGEECGCPADIYSVGATLYTALYGHAPFAVAGLGKRAYIEHVHTGDIAYPPIDGISEPVNAAIVDLLSAALERDVAARTSSVEMIGRGLQEIQQAMGLAATELEIPQTETWNTPPSGIVPL
ncbi:hypothetical protein CT171_03285 [Trueperella pyogenes]|uniref:serine/threonine-protein kinase n=1 Tax=Trueperella pyogenes TaxID=1661 RepID=UPI000C1B60CA|nr:serine/threonine-protein kinase [Trueperella pyogenes]PIN52644.1 hypothetical protein CT171_03285 [Trueperella pyogenes]